MPEIFVTPHAVEQYCERVHPGVSPERAKVAITDSLQHPLFCLLHRDEAVLWGCLDAKAVPFLVLTAPADADAPYLLVKTCGPWWWWKEARLNWKQHNRGSKRRPIYDPDYDRLSPAPAV